MLSIINSLEVMTALFNAGLAIFIFRGNWKQPMNVFMGVYLVALSVWAVGLVGTQIGDSYQLWLYSTKATYIMGLIIASSFYLFSIAFPEGIRPRTLTIMAAYGFSAVYSAILLIDPNFLTLSIVSHAWGNSAVLEPVAYVIYVILFCVLYVGGLVRIWWKYFHSAGVTRIQLLVIALGVSITGISGLYFDIILASPFLNEFRYIWTGPVLNTFMAVLIVYSVFRLRLFNAKVIVTEFLISLLWIVTFLRTMLASERQEQLFNGLLFFLALIIGALLIRSVKQEVRQRELIQKQEQALEVVNKQQENLLHFISHEIKGYLTKSQGAFASIVEGDYGTVSPQLKEMAAAALVDVRKGVATVMQILNASNLKKGTMSYDKKPFDFRASVLKVINDLGPEAGEKNLKIETSIADGDYMMNGDEHRIRSHVIRNIIDNAIKYTPTGVVHIELSDGEKIRFSVKDNGVGITNEDKQRLFTEGGHGKDSIKVNVHSTGYGLFIAKSIAEAHGGSIWAESEGPGKGSTFIVELPAI